MMSKNPHREMFSYWTWFAAHANWVLMDCRMDQQSGQWWRRYFTG